MEWTSGIVKLSTKEKRKSECQRLGHKRKKFTLTSFEHQQLKRNKKAQRLGCNSKQKYAPSMKAAACRGNPLGSNTPTSVVVPPISTTIMLFPDPSLLFRSIPARYDAPLIEFVAPEEKVLTGRRAASSAEVSVPSFWSN